MWWWLVLLVLQWSVISTQPITEDDNARVPRQTDTKECCPCPPRTTIHDTLDPSSLPSNLDAVRSPLFEDQDALDDLAGSASTVIPVHADGCPCMRDADSDVAASLLVPRNMLLPVMRTTFEPKEDPKPYLHPEVDLASSVLETIREATDEEYRDALARDAARSESKAADPDVTGADPIVNAARNIVTIILSPTSDEDLITQASHIHESRCIHSSLGNERLSSVSPIINPNLLFMSSEPKAIFVIPPQDLDSGVSASNVQESVVSSLSTPKESNKQSTGRDNTPKIPSIKPWIENFRNDLLRYTKIDDIVAVPVLKLNPNLFKSNFENDRLKGSGPINRKTPMLKKLADKGNELRSNSQNSDCDNSPSTSVIEKNREATNIPVDNSNINSLLPSKGLSDVLKPTNSPNILNLRDAELIPEDIIGEKEIKLKIPYIKLPQAVKSSDNSKTLTDQFWELPKLSDLIQNRKDTNKVVEPNVLEEKKENNVCIVNEVPKKFETKILDIIPSASTNDETVLVDSPITELHSQDDSSDLNFTEMDESSSPNDGIKTGDYTEELTDDAVKSSGKEGDVLNNVDLIQEESTLDEDNSQSSEPLSSKELQDMSDSILDASEKKEETACFETVDKNNNGLTKSSGDDTDNSSDSTASNDNASPSIAVSEENTHVEDSHEQTREENASPSIENSEENAHVENSHQQSREGLISEDLNSDASQVSEFIKPPNCEEVSTNNNQASKPDENINLKNQDVIGASSDSVVKTITRPASRPGPLKTLSSRLRDDNIIVQPSLPDMSNILPTIDINDLFRSSTIPMLPSLDEIRSRISNFLRMPELRLSDDGDDNSSDMDDDSNTQFPSLALLKPKQPTEIVDLDVFQIRPLSSSRTNFQTSRDPLGRGMDLDSFKAKLRVPANVVKPVKLQSILGNDGRLLGARLTVEPTKSLFKNRKISNQILGSPGRLAPKGSSNLKKSFSKPYLPGVTRSSMQSQAQNLLRNNKIVKNPIVDNLQASKPTLSVGNLRENLRSEASNILGSLPSLPDLHDTTSNLQAHVHDLIDNSKLLSSNLNPAIGSLRSNSPLQNQLHQSFKSSNILESLPTLRSLEETKSNLQSRTQDIIQNAKNLSPALNPALQSKLLSQSFPPLSDLRESLKSGASNIIGSVSHLPAIENTVSNVQARAQDIIENSQMLTPNLNEAIENLQFSDPIQQLSDLRENIKADSSNILGSLPTLPSLEETRSNLQSRAQDIIQNAKNLSPAFNPELRSNLHIQPISPLSDLRENLKSEASNIISSVPSLPTVKETISSLQARAQNIIENSQMLTPNLDEAIGNLQFGDPIKQLSDLRENIKAESSNIMESLPSLPSLEENISNLQSRAHDLIGNSKILTPDLSPVLERLGSSSPIVQINDLRDNLRSEAYNVLESLPTLEATTGNLQSRAHELLANSIVSSFNPGITNLGSTIPQIDDLRDNLRSEASSLLESLPTLPTLEEAKANLQARTQDIIDNAKLSMPHLNTISQLSDLNALNARASESFSNLHQNLSSSMKEAKLRGDNILEKVQSQAINGKLGQTNPRMKLADISKSNPKQTDGYKIKFSQSAPIQSLAKPKYSEKPRESTSSKLKNMSVLKSDSVRTNDRRIQPSQLSQSGSGNKETLQLRRPSVRNKNKSKIQVAPTTFRPTLRIASQPTLKSVTENQDFYASKFTTKSPLTIPRSKLSRFTSTTASTPKKTTVLKSAMTDKPFSIESLSRPSLGLQKKINEPRLKTIIDPKYVTDSEQKRPKDAFGAQSQAHQSKYPPRLMVKSSSSSRKADENVQGTLPTQSSIKLKSSLPKSNSELNKLATTGIKPISNIYSQLDESERLLSKLRESVKERLASVAPVDSKLADTKSLLQSRAQKTNNANAKTVPSQEDVDIISDKPESILTKLRNSIRDSDLNRLAKENGQRSNVDLAEGASEILGQAQPLKGREKPMKENKSYRCRMICTEEN